MRADLLIGNSDFAFFWLRCVISALAVVLTLTLGCIVGFCAACILPPLYRLHQGNEQEKRSG